MPLHFVGQWSMQVPFLLQLVLEKKKIDISANISVHAMALNSLANFDDSQEMKGNNVLHNREASY